MDTVPPPEIQYPIAATVSASFQEKSPLVVRDPDELVVVVMGMGLGGWVLRLSAALGLKGLGLRT